MCVFAADAYVGGCVAHLCDWEAEKVLRAPLQDWHQPYPPGQSLARQLCLTMFAPQQNTFSISNFHSVAPADRHKSALKEMDSLQQ